MAKFAGRNDSKKEEDMPLAETRSEGKSIDGKTHGLGSLICRNVHSRQSVAVFVAGAVSFAALSLGVVCAAQADTEGSTGALAGSLDVFQAMGMTDFTNSYGGTNDSGEFGYVRNDYIGCVIGVGGSVTIDQFGTTTSTHNHAGMITFGNLKGSLMYQTDDKQALVGFGTAEEFDTNGQPAGHGVWPIPANWTITAGGIIYDYSAYVRAQVDGPTGTTTSVVGRDTAYSINPRYVNGVFYCQANIAAATGTSTAGNTGVELRQEVRLYRSTAQMHWLIQNTDSVAHQVAFRFTVPIRGLRTGYGGSHGGFIFPDPLHGNLPTNITEVIPGASLPDSLTFYGAREETDNITSPPFASRFVFRDPNGLTPTPPTVPTQVFVGESDGLRPEDTGFDPAQTFSSSFTQFVEGAVAAIYYGPYGVPAGGTQDVYAYFGNGEPTELMREDAVLAAESTEAVGLNTAEANDANVVGNPNLVTNPTLLATVRQEFLSPRPIPIYGSLFNRKLATPLSNIQLINTNLSLNLPSGMSFGLVQPANTTIDTSLRTIGTVNGDTDAATTWYAQANGDTYGVLTYQIAASYGDASTGTSVTRVVSRPITIPAEPLEPVTSASFQMLGLPFDFDPVESNNGDPATIFNALAPTALRDQRTLFYKYVPDPENVGGYGAYQVVSQVQKGFGYFYKPDLSRIVYAAGVLPSSGQADPIDNATLSTDVPATTGQVQIQIPAGWNIISDPFVYQIPLDNIRLLSTNGTDLGDAADGGLPFLDAITSGVVQGTLWTYDTATQSYDTPEDLTTATIDPWVGYFINVTSPVILVYSPPNQHNSVVIPDPQTGVPVTRAAKKTLFGTTRSLATAASDQEWKLQFITLRSDGKGDRSTMIGVSRSVKASSAMLAKPPAPMNNYVYSSLVSGMAKSRYAQILQSPTATGPRTWTLELSSDSDGPVTLQWPNLAASLPRTVSLSMTDTSTNHTYALRSLSSLQVSLKKSVPYRFQIVAKAQQSLPLSVSNLHSVRGSGRSATGGLSSYQFGFELSQDADVTGTVRTMSGRVIATLGSGRSMSAGLKTLTWNGRSSAGAAVAPGSYMIRVEATDASGNSSHMESFFMSLR